MSPTKWIALILGTGATVLAAACSDGGVTFNDDDPKADGGDGTGDGGGGCTTRVGESVTDVCTLYQGKPDTALTIQLREQCGSACNGATGLPTCSVTVAGADITLSLDQQVCSPQTDQACDLSCRINAFDCKLPALPKGEYNLRFDSPARDARTTLRITEGGAQTSCELGQPNVNPPPVTTDAFNTADCRTATDACVPVLSGDACRPCACPEGAVLASQKAAYEATYFETKSKCTDQGEGPVCAACVEATAECNATTGKCEIKK